MRATILAFVSLAAGQVLAQQAAPPGLPPLFFREEWKQIERPANAPADFVPEGGVTPAAVTNASLELRLYDPSAKSIPGYLKQPPTGSIARDWGGPSCIQLAGYNQNPPPPTVAAGSRTDPPNLWTGVCHTAVAATLRDRSRYVDLTGRAKIRWVTRTSGFHVVRPVVKLADGTWLVGDHTDGTVRDWLVTEFSFGDVRWMKLDINRAVTTGTILDKVDLSKVDEIGFVDLMPGSGHGQGGWVDVALVEVYGGSVPRAGSSASQ